MTAALVSFIRRNGSGWEVVTVSIWSSICSIESFHKSNVSDLPKENMKKRRALRFKVLLWM